MNEAVARFASVRRPATSLACNDALAFSATPSSWFARFQWDQDPQAFLWCRSPTADWIESPRDAGWNLVAFWLPLAYPSNCPCVIVRHALIGQLLAASFPSIVVATA